MSDPKYVEPDYWESDLSDARLPDAGTSRRRYVVDGRNYWARPDEVPALLEAVLKQPPAPVAKRTARGRQRPAKALPRAPATTLSEPVIAARYAALRIEFEQRDDGALLAALHGAYLRLARRRDEDDVEALLLAI
jgi:hypothetical protein